MPVFRYEAADAGGKILRGAMDARTVAEVQQILTRRGYRVVEVQDTQAVAQARQQIANPTPVAASGGFTFAGGAKPEDLGIFFRQITSLVHSGFSVGAAFGDMGMRGGNRAIRTASQSVAQNVLNGSTLAGAMAQHPLVFAPHVIALVQAGESGGFLEFAFEECALNAEQDAALRQGLWWARFLTWQSIWSVILLQPMVSFLPLLVSGKFVEYGKSIFLWWVILGIVFHAGAFVIQLLWRQPSLANVRDRMALRLPVMAWLARVRGLAVFTRVLRRLLMSGVSAEPAFVGAARAIPNTVLSARMLGGVPILRQGRGMDEAVAASHLMDDDPVQMLVTGQKTGQWIEMLDRVTGFYQEEAARATDSAKSAQRRVGVLLTIISTGYVTIVTTWGLLQGQMMFVNKFFSE